MGSKMQPYNKGDEKRGSLRRPIKEVALINKGIFEKDIFFSIALNISASGILIETDKIMALGDKIKCTFMLQHRIDVAGEVIRVVRKAQDIYHYGVRFFNIDHGAKAEIEELARGNRWMKGT